jgi:hypothetical protein
MLADKVRDLGLNGLGQQDTRSIAQNFGELVDDVSWLNQLDDVIFGHGISLLRWRSGGVKHPHDMPPFRFLPSPTFGDSSKAPARPQIGANAAVGSKAEELTAGTTCWELTIQQTLRLGGSGPIAPFWPCADRI